MDEACRTYGDVHTGSWWGDPGIDCGIWKWIFKKWGGGHWLDWYGLEQVWSSCECSNVPVGYGLYHRNNSGKMYCSAV